jgi:hypothetical protein
MERVWVSGKYFTLYFAAPGSFYHFFFQLSPNFGGRIRAFGYDAADAGGALLFRLRQFFFFDPD